MQPEERDAPTPYELIGGDARVRELVDRFYDLMDFEPRYEVLRRARHLPFAIGTEERDQWMACMTQAMEETEVPQELRMALAGAFFKTADWMRNKPEER